MSLELRKSSNWWYGVFTVNGRRQIINLGVSIEGRRPPKRTLLGDDVFERSRGMALAEYERRRREFNEERTTEKAIRKFVELKTGQELTFPLLEDLAKLWKGITRRRAPSARYENACRKILDRFVEFARKKQPNATEFVSVTRETAAAFFEAESKRGVSPTTWNYTLKVLRTTFRRLHPQLTDASNPFRDFVTKEKQTVGRQPFSPEELRDIVQASERDLFIRPIIIAGMSTAMRRGDCCLLKWSDVDLTAGFLSVKTAKTGEKVDIPIFPLLSEELAKARTTAGNSKFCFPEQALKYRSNPDGITRRVKRVIAQALEQREVRNGKVSMALSAEEARSRGLAYIEGLEQSARTVRMREVFDVYMSGKPTDAVMADTGCGRGTVSHYLNEIQAHIGGTFIRGGTSRPSLSLLQVPRPGGLRRASVRDFHSFRVTWITLALAAGVPLELVQRVTGHRTVEVVMKHYFRPGREDFRQLLTKAMPRLLGEGAASSPKEEMRALIDAVKPAALRNRMMAVWSKL